jgi:hypothetical protein
MAISWYLCPYDMIVAPDGGRGRSCAMRRHILAVILGSSWDELEIMGNHTLVKVDAPLAIHTLIRADADFTEIPNPIPGGRQAALRTKLVSLGYTDAEVTATGFSFDAVLALLASTRSNIQMSADQQTIVVVAGRRTASKTLTDINQRLPG